MKDEPFEKDLGDMLIEGERAGIASKDGEGEVERVGEAFAAGVDSGIEGAMLMEETRTSLMSESFRPF